MLFRRLHNPACNTGQVEFTLAEPYSKLPDTHLILWEVCIQKFNYRRKPKNIMKANAINSVVEHLPRVDGY